MTNTTVQRRERAADRKDATSNKHVNYRECSLLLVSQPSGEDKTRVGLKAALATQDFHTGSFKAKGKGGQCASREAFETSLTVDTHHQTSGVATGGHAEGA